MPDSASKIQNFEEKNNNWKTISIEGAVSSERLLSFKNSNFALFVFHFFVRSFVRSFVRLFRKENYFDFLLLVKFCRASKYDNFEFFPKSSKSLNLIYFYVSLRQQEQIRRRNLQYSLSYESARACNQFIYKLLY